MKEEVIKMARKARKKYETVKGYTYIREARTIRRKGPDGKIEVVHLKPKKIHVRPHKSRKPRIRRTRITL